VALAQSASQHAISTDTERHTGLSAIAEDLDRRSNCSTVRQPAVREVVTTKQALLEFTTVLTAVSPNKIRMICTVHDER